MKQRRAFWHLAGIVLVWSLAVDRVASQVEATTDLWRLYSDVLAQCKYVDLTHTFNATNPVWPGFANATIGPAVAGVDIPGYVQKGEPFQYDRHGFIATAYFLPTDQYGTQLDPPAHWDQYGATISDLPATYCIRPLVVIDIHEKVAQDPGYHCSVADIHEWEMRHGTIPEGAVVFIRSDWSKRWPDKAAFGARPFPGITLEALKFLHLERKILFHGHEPLDTDTTATLVGEDWLLHNHYCQAEGVANLDQVPEAGALVAIGFAKPEGGTGGYARYIAICPPDWEYGVSVMEVPGAPLPRQAYPLKRDRDGVLRPTPE
jgi:kynurenine formamidase